VVANLTLKYTVEIGSMLMYFKLLSIYQKFRQRVPLEQTEVRLFHLY